MFDWKGGKARLGAKKEAALAMTLDAELFPTTATRGVVANKGRSVFFSWSEKKRMIFPEKTLINIDSELSSK